MKLVFYWDLVGLMPVHSVGQEHTKKKHFIGVLSFTAIGAISMNKVLALMTMNDSMDRQAFAIFIQHFLCPQLWEGAVSCSAFKLHSQNLIKFLWGGLS